MGLPINRPGVHPVRVMLTAPAPRRFPASLPTAVGRATKKAPLASPLRTAKTIRTASVDAKDHIANMVTPLRAMASSNVFILPNLSQANPDVRRPIAIDALKQATTPAETELEKPREVVTAGKKNGGA